MQISEQDQTPVIFRTYKTAPFETVARVAWNSVLILGHQDGAAHNVRGPLEKYRGVSAGLRIDGVAWVERGIGFAGGKWALVGLGVDRGVRREYV
jgi:hypothetical protein